MSGKQEGQPAASQEIRVTSGGPALPLAGAPTFSLRDYLSKDHIQTAAFFARQSRLIEQEYSGKHWGEVFGSGVFNQHRAYVTGAIFAAVAFLEATINELFTDAEERYGDDLVAQNRSKEISKRIVEVWGEQRDRRSTNGRRPTTLSTNR